MIVKPSDTIAVWFSCGAASAVAAKLTLDKYRGTCTVRVVNNPVAEEDSDNRRFLRDIEQWLGVEIEMAINPKYPECSAVEVWEKRKFMAGIHGAPCTGELKKKARQHWENSNKADWHVLGFTADEVDRHEQFALTERENVLPILINAGLTKSDCWAILLDEGIALPRVYDWGLPNANCLGCVKATSPTYWNLIRQVAPDVFASRAEQSRRLGVRLVRVKGKRIFLDELDPAAKGNSMETLGAECGSFCEERQPSLFYGNGPAA